MVCRARTLGCLAFATGALFAAGLARAAGEAQAPALELQLAQPAGQAAIVVALRNRSERPIVVNARFAHGRQDVYPVELDLALSGTAPGKRERPTCRLRIGRSTQLATLAPAQSLRKRLALDELCLPALRRPGRYRLAVTYRNSRRNDATGKGWQGELRRELELVVERR